LNSAAANAPPRRLICADLSFPQLQNRRTGCPRSFKAAQIVRGYLAWLPWQQFPHWAGLAEEPRHGRYVLSSPASPERLTNSSPPLVPAILPGDLSAQRQ